MAELRVSVCHARPDLQFLEELSLPQGQCCATRWNAAA